MEREDDLVVFEMFDDPMQANIVKGVLESNGVDAEVIGDTTANTLMRGFTQGAMRVVVRRRDLPMAQEIMQTRPLE